MKKKIVKPYQIGNIYWPILYKSSNKPKDFDDKWLKSLQSIKEWTVNR